MKNNRIRDVRKAAGMTQAQLAKSLGVNRATLSRYESGNIDPPSSQLQRIANALGVGISELTSDEEKVVKVHIDKEPVGKIRIKTTQEDSRYSNLTEKEKIDRLNHTLDEIAEKICSST